jgi:hypothetical protein
MKRSASFNGFDLESFSATSLRVASATNEDGEALCYCPIETVLMVSAYAVNPSITPEEAQRAGDAIDRQLEWHAQQAGIQKMLVVLPKDHPGLPLDEFKEVRVFERKIPQSAMMGLGSFNTKPAATFLN